MTIKESSPGHIIGGIRIVHKPLLVTITNHTKTAESIEIPFVGMTRVGLRKHMY